VTSAGDSVPPDHGSKPTPPSASGGPQQTAVWYFIAATFVLVAPMMLFPDADLWMRLIPFALGVLLLVLGGLQLKREVGDRRNGERSGPPRE
jgi:membrane protein implicated in regulation of membrane protease activity